jgi:hypothetical protein
MAPEHQQASCGLTRTRPTLECVSPPDARVYVRRVGTPPHHRRAQRAQDAARRCSAAAHDRTLTDRGRQVCAAAPSAAACLRRRRRALRRRRARTLPAVHRRTVGGVRWAVGCAERRRQHTALRVRGQRTRSGGKELSDHGGAARSGGKEPIGAERRWMRSRSRSRGRRCHSECKVAVVPLFGRQPANSVAKRTPAANCVGACGERGCVPTRVRVTAGVGPAG